MATFDKDFKVKNGLQVASGGSFGGPVVVGTPTENNHAATKQYVDENSGGGGGSSVTVSDTKPTTASEGDLWFDSLSGRFFIYYDSFWIEVSSSTGGEPLNTFLLMGA